MNNIMKYTLTLCIGAAATLDALFNVYNEINTKIEIMDTGVKVIQTSANADVVKLL